MSDGVPPGNFLPGAAPGCHVAFSASAAEALLVHPPSPCPPLWAVDWSPFDVEDYGLTEEQVEEGAVPDLSLDPESGLLTCINTSAAVRSFALTVGHRCRGRSSVLSAGLARDRDGAERAVVTLLVVLGPRETMDVCYVDVRARLRLEDATAAKAAAVTATAGGGKKRRRRRKKKGGGGGGGEVSAPGTMDGKESEETAGEVDLFSDIKDIDLGEAKAAAERLLFDAASLPASQVIAFPLEHVGREHAAEGFLCSQGCGGALTHFFPATCHAVDLNCDVGTNVLAVGDGEILEVRQDSSVGGIDARYLFAWNSIQLKLDVGPVVDYVHIKQGSASVKVGDRVKRGDLLCLSGDVGFCPTPHLHLQMHLSSDPGAPTVPFAFRDASPDAAIECPCAGARLAVV